MNQLAVREVKKSNSVALKETFFTESQKQIIKDIYFKGCTDDEFVTFLYICERSGLDPILKQIYPVKRWDSKLKKEVMTAQTSVDGYRIIAERTGHYCPGRQPSFRYDNNGKLLSATAYVKKLTSDGTWHEIAATAFYSEYVQKNKEGQPTKFWVDMPHGQLAKCAETLAIRKAHPYDLSAIRSDEEMAQADCVDISPKKTEVKQLYISNDQIQELDSYIECLNMKFRDKFLDYLEKKYKSLDLKIIPDSDFPNIVTILQRGLESSREEKDAELKALKNKESEVKEENVDWSDMEVK